MLEKMFKNGKSIETRVLLRHARNAKDIHGIDLGRNAPDAPAKRIKDCPITFVECFYALFEKELDAVGIHDLDQLEEQIVDLQDLREEVLPDIEGFFPLVRTAGIVEQVLQNGDLMSKMLAQVGSQRAIASGSTS